MGMTRLEGFSLHRLLHASVDPAPVIGDILFCGGHENLLENRYERPASPNRQRRSPDHLRVASRTLSAALPAADCTVTAAFSATPSASDRKSVVEGKSVSVRVELGGPRSFKKKNT